MGNVRWEEYGFGRCVELREVVDEGIFDGYSFPCPTAIWEFHPGDIVCFPPFEHLGMEVLCASISLFVPMSL